MRGKTGSRSNATPCHVGFNEAPAECGGKPDMNLNEILAIVASMRPPQNAGENANVSCHQIDFARLQ